MYAPIFPLLLSLLVAAGCAGRSPRDQANDEKVAATYREIGIRELSLGMHAEAVRDLHRSIEADSNDAATYHYLGLAYLQIGQYDEAETTLKQSLELKPDLGEAHNTLGTLYSLQRRWPEAEAAFRQALASPGYRTPEAAHYNLARLYAAQDDKQAAETSCEAALASNPAYLPPYLQLVQLLEERGDMEGAERTLRRALTRYPDDAEIHFALGKLLYRQQLYRSALVSLKEAYRLAEGPTRAKIQRYIDILE